MDRIVISALRVETVIGVHAWERRIRQPVVFDLEVAADVARAAGSDDLADALDYEAMTGRVREFVEASTFELLESLAERVAGLVREEFGVDWLRLRLSKPGAVRGAREVCVVIERGVMAPGGGDAA